MIPATKYPERTGKKLWSMTNVILKNIYECEREEHKHGQIS